MAGGRKKVRRRNRTNTAAHPRAPKQKNGPRRPARAAVIPPLRRTGNLDDAAPAGARRAALPVFVAPCLSTLADRPPDSENWIHEIKFDGYRIQARLDHGKVKLLTPQGLDWVKKFPTVATTRSE